MSGFRETVRTNVPVVVGQISRADVTMEIGGVTEVVEVTSAVQLLQTDRADTRTELKGGNPQSVGLQAAKDHVAPRIGGVYRLNEDTVVRSGYGLAFESRPWAQNFRGHASYPLAINTTFDTPAAISQFGWYGTLDQGIPFVVGPDTSSGRVPLPNTVGMTSPSLDAGRRPRTHSWNVAFERRLPLVSVDLAYVGNKSVDVRQNIDHNARPHARRRRHRSAVL